MRPRAIRVGFVRLEIWDKPTPNWDGLALIYLTQWRQRLQNFFAVTGLFSCCSLTGALQGESGQRRALTRTPALTLSPVEQAIWLPLSVHTHPRSVQGVLPESEARSLTALKSMPKSSAFTSKIKPHSPLMSIQRTSFTQSYQTGERETGGASRSGQQSEVNRPWFHGRNAITIQPTKPVFSGRVFSSGLARGSPEEYGGELAASGGVR